MQSEPEVRAFRHKASSLLCVKDGHLQVQGAAHTANFCQNQQALCQMPGSATAGFEAKGGSGISRKSVLDQSWTRGNG